MAGETATQDQASSTHPSTLKTEFELNITEDLPTQDQLRSILDYVGAQRAGEVIKGASDEKDALKKWKADNGSFERPLACSIPRLLGALLILYRLSTGTMVRPWLEIVSRRS